MRSMNIERKNMEDEMNVVKQSAEYQCTGGTPLTVLIFDLVIPYATSSPEKRVRVPLLAIV